MVGLAYDRFFSEGAAFFYLSKMLIVTCKLYVHNLNILLKQKQRPATCGADPIL